MTSLASPSSAPKEGSLASKIRARIAEHVGVDVECINDDLHLSEDFGFDLLDIIELTILLEEQFGAEREITDEPNQIEFVGGLIRHIERQSIGSHR
jgi:acyl carrier protein